MSLLCYFSAMLAKALPFPVITGSNSHHTLTWSRRPNMFFPQHWEFIAWTMFCPYIAQIGSFSQRIHMSIWPEWFPGVRALNIHTHTSDLCLLSVQADLLEMRSDKRRAHFATWSVFCQWSRPQTPHTIAEIITESGCCEGFMYTHF